MALGVRDAGTLRTALKLRVKHDGVLRDAKVLKIMADGELRTAAVFAGELSVTANDAQGNPKAGSTADVTTSNSSATVSGGVGPYTYAWTIVSSGGGNASTALSPASASTMFRKTAVPDGAAYVDTWKVTVTDSFGTTATDTISATFQNIEIPGGTE